MTPPGLSGKGHSRHHPLRTPSPQFSAPSFLPRVELSNKAARRDWPCLQMVTLLLGPPQFLEYQAGVLCSQFVDEETEAREGDCRAGMTIKGVVTCKAFRTGPAWHTANTQNTSSYLLFVTAPLSP